MEAIMPNQQDIDAIKQVVADAQRYQSDAERFPALLTPDVNLINFVGLRVVGRDTIAGMIQAALQTALSALLPNTNYWKFLC
ncbi:hypothetical protein [Paraflavitalea speifideaquila]|uniref:hypothetical protein n=1 Tax=Paraflavitalea speifideaquila TaxID=3076558 RepID=UPI0028E51B59|nr:hypothetical protein [Paraflavitalea speifideiaquila]